jgi:hypothetical protein
MNMSTETFLVVCRIPTGPPFNICGVSAGGNWAEVITFQSGSWQGGTDQTDLGTGLQTIHTSSSTLFTPPLLTQLFRKVRLTIKCFLFPSQTCG